MNATITEEQLYTLLGMLQKLADGGNNLSNTANELTQDILEIVKVARDANEGPLRERKKCMTRTALARLVSDPAHP